MLQIMILMTGQQQSFSNCLIETSTQISDLNTLQIKSD